jgi:hypothetical protein
MNTPSLVSGLMLFALASAAALVLGLQACSQNQPPPIEDIDTGWVRYDGGAPADAGSPDKPYVQKCPEPSGEMVAVEGQVLFDGTVPPDGEISVAITKTPPPGMPSCYLTTKAKKFPFSFKFEQLEKDSEVYVMAVLKMQSGGLPIPTKCVDYYGDLGSTPMKLVSDMTGLSITLDLYKKSECP